MQRLILAEACFFAQFGWTLLILCRCSAAPNSLDAPLKSLILYALALILHALYPPLEGCHGRLMGVKIGARSTLEPPPKPDPASPWPDMPSI